MKVKMFKHKVNEDGEGGVCSPMSTLTNTPGMGNTVPASNAGMTLGQQMSPSTKGSGDLFGNNTKKKK